ncbi:FadR/GntR family transcriptional regulator [Roseovarius spongiae]|uniref:FadR/GntR family transcriptional regulator n=1 Tax=Roseovarius spongiae TaxID=2320272 RepID=UPI00140E288D|nr:FadR/GntR family transcriptional regulator [Roseovarius spongiae]
MARRKTLTTIVAEELSKKILDGALQPNEQLPTESELCEQFEVSRTVVREAVAQLRSDGLLVSRQGRGMFVAEYPFSSRFKLDADALNTLPETIAILELRLAIEVESASLCAERRSDSDAVQIRRVMEEVDARHMDPESVEVHYDFEFHLAIAQGTQNPYFHRFLKFLEPTFTRRFQLSALVSQEFKDDYYIAIHDEHEAIVVTIENRDPEAARAAMRLHLRNSLERLRALSRKVGLKDRVGDDDIRIMDFLKDAGPGPDDPPAT